VRLFLTTTVSIVLTVNSTCPSIWGLVSRGPPARELDAVAPELAGELAGNAPLAQRGNKRVIAALLEAESELPAKVERRSSSCASSRSPRGHARGGHARGDEGIR
jgi:enoyl-CoA hydratase/carnithine racemase